jgi:hypothetical protein
MHQKDLARQAWQDAGLYRSRNKTLQAFLRRFEESESDCWDDLAEAVRTGYPELKTKLATPLWDTGDKLLRLNLLRLADPDQQDEVALLKRFTGKLDPVRDVPEIRTLARIDNPDVLGRLAKVRGLPAELGATIAARREGLAARRKGAKPKAPSRPRSTATKRRTRQGRSA